MSRASPCRSRVSAESGSARSVGLDFFMSLGLVAERVVGIRAVHDLTEQDQCCIARQVVLLEDGLKRTLFAVMPQLHIFHVVGYGSFALGHLHHLVGRYEQEIGILVHKLFDEPGAGHAVYLDVFTSNPLHRRVLLLVASTAKRTKIA